MATGESLGHLNCLLFRGLIKKYLTTINVGMSKVKLSSEAKAWILYDGGNSAFATTVIAAFFPIFFNDFWASELEAEVKTSYLGGV